jgi:transcriptional regulator
VYVPPAFAEDRPEVLLDFVDAHPLGVLVTASPALYATHLPLLLDRTRGPLGVLQGHVARANPHVGAQTTCEALVIFAGPDAYITPGWYASKAEHGRVVPTWNYVAVHATGTLRFVDDPGYLLGHVAALSRRHEAGRARPWSVDDAPPGYVEKLARDIVGVEVEIARLEGKWKMSQNRPAADIAGVIDGLRADGVHDVASVVEERRPASKR